MSIRRWIRNWLNSEDSVLKLGRSEANVVSGETPDGVHISITKAINGRVLTLRSYQPNRKNVPQVHSDWLTEYYVIKDGESLTEALTMLLITKGLEE